MGGKRYAEMKIKQLEWVVDFILLFSLFVALTGLHKLHSLGQPLAGVISEAVGLAAVCTLFNWIRRHGSD